MTKMLLVLAGALGVGMGSARAQVPAAAPAGATGICKDGSYSTAASKSGACRGHKGVQTWYGTPAAAVAAPGSGAKVESMPAPGAGAPASVAAAPAPTPVKRLGPEQAAAAKPVAPGGGPGLVWLNTGDNVYHCNGDSYYGKTKAGAYMSEADAKAKGGRPAAGKVCTGK